MATRPPPPRRPNAVIGQGHSHVAVGRPNAALTRPSIMQRPNTALVTAQPRPVRIGRARIGWPTLFFAGLLAAFAISILGYQMGRVPTPGEMDANSKAEAQAAYERGKALLDRRSHIAAIDEFDDAIRRDPTFATAYVQRGIGHSKDGHCGKAIADFSEAIRLQSEPSASVLALRGHCFLEIGEYTRALHDFERGIEVDANDVALYIGRSQAYFSLLRFADAIQDMEKALMLDRTEVELLPALSMAYLIMGRPSDAAKTAESYNERKEWRGKLVLLVAILAHAAHMQAGNTAAARATIDRAASFGRSGNHLFMAIRYLRGEANERQVIDWALNSEVRMLSYTIIGIANLTSATGGDPSSPSYEPEGLRRAKLNFELAAKHEWRTEVRDEGWNPIFHFVRGMLKKIEARDT